MVFGYQKEKKKIGCLGMSHTSYYYLNNLGEFDILIFGYMDLDMYEQGVTNSNLDMNLGGRSLNGYMGMKVETPNGQQ